MGVSTRKRKEECSHGDDTSIVEIAGRPMCLNGVSVILAFGFELYHYAQSGPHIKLYP